MNANQVDGDLAAEATSVRDGSEDSKYHTLPDSTRRRIEITARGPRLIGRSRCGVVIGAKSAFGPATDDRPLRCYRAAIPRSAHATASFQFSSVGADPQDLKYSRRAVTTRNRGQSIREFTTIHRWHEGGGMLTRLGRPLP